jgi:hypothetical protein
MYPGHEPPPNTTNSCIQNTSKQTITNFVNSATMRIPLRSTLHPRQIPELKSNYDTIYTPSHIQGILQKYFDGFTIYIQ